MCRLRPFIQANLRGVVAFCWHDGLVNPYLSATAEELIARYVGAKASAFKPPTAGRPSRGGLERFA
jgi:hypothetical protein